MQRLSLLMLFLAAAAGATALTAQAPTDQLLYATTYQERLAILWVNNLDGETVILGKAFRPEATHRVSVSITGKKAPGGSRKEAKMAVFGNSGHEKRIEQLLVASFPLTVRATFRVSERLPRQGKPAILTEAPEPGSSIVVFCTLTGEEYTKCVADEDPVSAVDRATCLRLADGSERLDAEVCEELPEVSPVASILELESRGDGAPGG